MRALFLLLLLAFPQDPAVRDLLQQLEDDNADVREKAQKQLGGLGESAIPLLKEVAESPRSSGELKLRVLAALKEIDLAGKTAKVYVEPKRVTLKADGTVLREILDELARQSGLKIDSVLVDGAAPVTIDARDLSAQNVLDLLCAGRQDRTWETQDDGTIRLLKDRHPACPAVYVGPFRVRVQSLSVERGTDFKGKTVTATATLAADWDRRLKPSKIVEIDVTKVTDGTDAAIDVAAADAGVMVVRGVPGAQIRVAGMNFPEAGDHTRAFSLKNLSPSAGTIDLEGAARFTFPLDYKDVRIEKPGAIETRDLGDTQAKVTRGGTSEIWTLSFHKSASATTPAWSRQIAQRFDPDSFVVVDVEGNEFTATMRAPALRGRQMDLASEAGVWYQAPIPRNPALAIKEVRFRFVDQTLVKVVPFKFTGLALP